MVQTQDKITLPRFISNGMILQRNASVKIWGWASAGETLQLTFMDKIYSTTVDSMGNWQIEFWTAQAGGPYEMTIKTQMDPQETVIKNILLGDVYLCSGQSNMEMKMLSVKDRFPEDIEGANNDFIRQFLVPVTYDFKKPREKLESGSWEAVNSESILSFTAVGFYFANKLYQKYKIPIGLINASLGGAPAQAFMSEDAIRQFPEYLEAAVMMRDDAYLEAVLKQNQTSAEQWFSHLNQGDIGIPAEGITFYDPEYDASDWQSIPLPSYWEEEGIGAFNGVVWFRRDIEISSMLLERTPSRIFMGNVVDEDTVYINGIKVGSTPFQYAPRKYDISEGVIKEGRNTIVVRVVNCSGKGGFYKEKPYHLQLGDEIINLCGEWQYKIGVKSEPIPAPVFVSWQPTGLYNGMLAPMLQYTLAGVLWYQGESNAQTPQNYEKLLTAMINDWREKWEQKALPFLLVQLPNYLETFAASAGNWPLIREAQRKTLAVSGTGMAVTIDIGEWNDVHPLNKKEVGYRLALIARKLIYGEKDLVASGPLFKAASTEGNHMIVSFMEMGSGLITKDGKEPGCFELAGEDKGFILAQTAIEKDCVVVWNDKINEPVYVRYAWTDNPEGANLYNREGLPASPFTTL